MKRFWILTVLLLLSRTMDAATTYMYIPDLKHELNPIASVLGGGWGALLALQGLGLAAVIYTLYISVTKKVQTPAIPRDISLSRFISVFNFGNEYSFRKLFYALPTQRYAFLSSMGYVLTHTLIAISFTVGTSTTFLILSKGYERFYGQYHLPYVLMGLAGLLAFFFSRRFYRKELEVRLAFQ